MNWADERVALLFGGLGSEADVSRDGKQNVAQAMREIGIEPIEIDIKDGLLEPLMAANPTRVFNLVHGRPGEDGVLQGLLCALGIPFTGSGVGASALAFDKPRTKQVWESLGLPTAPMVVVNDLEQADICVKRLGPELFVKPAHEGSSVGAHAVHGADQLKVAIEDGKSFYKLTIKEKDEIVAYNISANEYDMSVIGRHLDPEAFNHKMDQKRSVVVDMRNYYESEVGKFSGAITPNVSKSKELLPEVKNLLKGHEKDPVLLYCTGGIRCEKASSYLIHSGFEDVYQLSGGIIKYAHEVKKKNLSSKFKGKNFVFDARMGERITEDIIGACYQCGAQSDNHLDCNNDACHVLFIQCIACKEEYNGCCSTECKNFSELSLDQQRDFRKDPNKIVSKARYSFRTESINKG